MTQVLQMIAVSHSTARRWYDLRPTSATAGPARSIGLGPSSHSLGPFIPSWGWSPQVSADPSSADRPKLGRARMGKGGCPELGRSCANRRDGSAWLPRLLAPCRPRRPASPQASR